MKRRPSRVPVIAYTAERSIQGMAITDSQAHQVLYRICRRADLPQRGWHLLRHSFGTHAALFGANPWRLQAWMGHKRIDETMRYVHLAGTHPRLLPEEIPREAAGDPELDRRILRILGARSAVWMGLQHGTDRAMVGHPMGTEEGGRGKTGGDPPR